MTLKKYLIRRALFLVPVLILVTFLSFFLIHIAPGNPAEIMMSSPNGGADPVAVEEFRIAHGLDQPFIVQYLLWLKGIITLDFGYSYMSNQPVFPAVFDALKNTMILGFFSLIVALIIALPLGIISALKQNTIVDHICRIGSLAGVSIPNFWLAYLLIILFSLWLRWLPPSGFGSLPYMILPTLVLGISSAAMIMRMVRTSMLDVMGKEYIQTARGKGLPEKIVILRHGLRNALIPILTVIGLTIGFLFNGSVVVETIFGLPGIGSLMVNSILNYDYMMIQGTVLFVALIHLFINFCIDIVYIWINPEIRYDKTTA